MTNFNTDHNALALLMAQVQQLQADMQTLLKRTPNPDRVWLSSGDFGKLAGVSTATLKAYRAANTFRDEISIKSKDRGKRKDWLYHRDHALADIRKAQS